MLVLTPLVSEDPHSEAMYYFCFLRLKVSLLEFWVFRCDFVTLTVSLYPQLYHKALAKHFIQRQTLVLLWEVLFAGL